MDKQYHIELYNLLKQISELIFDLSDEVDVFGYSDLKILKLQSDLNWFDRKWINPYLKKKNK